MRVRIAACLSLLFAVPCAGAAWDVADPPGPRHTVSVDTRRTTWTNLDVSPDGRTIVFDLLGDLFLLPIDGGEARAITHGLTFDTQPRFSPDGRSIVFISDRSGAANVWIMDSDGRQPRQLTAESLRKTSAPAWSPDGRFITVRKHYTAARSIGAGEIWMYPVDGGSGVRLIERHSTQKDMGEPVFSPDGRYVYFSRESWPGDDFQYNKDVHRGIYQILALDRHRGSLETLVADTGGAVRPTPSPDGRSLAYVTRKGIDARGFSSALVVRDLESGAERIVYDALDQDAQEVWSNQGLYPAFAWLPDSSALLFWAEGQIHHVSLADGRSRIIPLHARQTYTVIQPPRFEFEAAPARFPVRMLRWVNVSPRGDRVAYQALGSIYVRDLPNGIPRRLTAQTDIFELYPSFSPDGEWIVYSTWSDAKLGAVLRTRIADGRTETLTRTPGRYLEPVVSPDARLVSFRGVGAGSLLSPLWSREHGLFQVPWAGGEAELISAADIHPQHCGAKRLVTQLTPHEDKPPGGPWLNDDRTLVAIEADGGRVRLAVTEFSTEYRVSPDCRWLARVEKGDVWVTPLVSTGSPVALKPDVSPVPQFRAPGSGGQYLSWSSEGTLHWALGPELYSWKFGTHGPQGSPVRRHIGFDARHSATADLIALHNGRFLTMRGEEVIERGTALIEGNRIRALGPSEAVAVPPNARRIDLEGRTVVPGFIDVHWHGEQAIDGIHPQQNWRHFASLALGVTTIFDPAPNSEDLFAAAELQKTGRIVAPRIFGTGTTLFGANRDYAPVLETYDDVLKALRQRRAVGATAVKAYLQPRREQQQMIIAAARELGLLVKAEQAMGLLDIFSQVADGSSSLEHNVPIVNLYDDVTQFWGQAGVDNVPTLLVALGSVFGDQYWYQRSEVWRHPLAARYVPPGKLRAESYRGLRVTQDDIGAFSISRSVERLRDAGVRIATGGHGQREGLGLHWEMGLLAAGGMSPMRVLQAATVRAAENIGYARDLGTLERGKLADMVVLDGDPLTDIAATERIRYVIANGLVYDPSTMSPLDGPARAPFFWEHASQ